MLDFLNFMRARMSEYFGYKVVQGSSTDELQVKPGMLMAKDFYNLLVNKQTMDDISNWQSMSESDMDKFAAKFFMKRVKGDLASGSIRIWVDVYKAYAITSNFRALAVDGSSYAAATASQTIIDPSTLVVSGDVYGKYYFDLRIIAVTAGSNFNKDEGQITGLSGIDFDYKFVTNLRKLTNGSAGETNAQFYTRLKYALNDRGLSNRRSLYANLRELFPNIQSLYAATAGDPFMTRDLLQAVDMSQPPRQSSFLGKTQGDTVVRSSAFYGTFPPEANSQGASQYNPLAVQSAFTFPQTIEAINPFNPDPGYHGYPLYQEASDDMYRGLYYDDFVRFMQVTTSDLVNIIDDVVGADAATLQVQGSLPGGWIIGAHGKAIGDTALPQTLSGTQVVSLDQATAAITITGGSVRPLSIMKDAKKRVGVKISGTFRAPSDSALSSSSKGSVFYNLIGGTAPAQGIINSFSGLGFGIRINDAPDGGGSANAVAFICNNDDINSVYYFRSHGEAAPSQTESALAETPLRIHGETDYNYELVVFSDTSVSLNIIATQPGVDKALSAPLTFTPSRTSMLVSEFEQKQNSSSYGSYCKITIDSPSAVTADSWTISKFKVVDLTAHRPHALFMFNTDGLEEPLDLVFRGYGQGYDNHAIVRGHTAYIWNIEQRGSIQGTTLLSSGSWEALGDISDSGGAGAITSSLKQRLSGIDRYTVNTRWGNVIIVMVVATGSSHAATSGNDDTVGDANAALVIDFIKLQDQNVDYFHGRNKCDIYINTTRNQDELRLNTITLTKTLATDFFTISAATGQDVPVADIVSVVDAETGNELQQGQYIVTRKNAADYNSARDVIYISASDYTSITVTYHTYVEVTDVQDYFDSKDFGRAIGDYMVRHKNPVYLDFGFSYSGTMTPVDLGAVIRQYFDENVDRVFAIESMLTYLFSNGYVTNVNRPVVVTRSYTNDDGTSTVSTFTDQTQIQDIQFFRIRGMNLNRIGG